MANRRYRKLNGKVPLRSVAASTLSVALLLGSATAANAQPADVNLPLFGRIPQANLGELFGANTDNSADVDKTLTEEQQAAVDNSPLNNLPDAPTRAPNAGTLVSKEVGKMMVDDRLWNANTYRIHYNSTDSMGNASVDTAIYLEPKTPWAGDGPRPVVAIAPGTQGTGEQCDPSVSLQKGPSIRLEPFDAVFPYEFIPLIDHLARGAAVVMIDHHRYDSGGQAYLDNIASAQSLLDAISATKDLGVSPDAPVGIYGYSQGGGTAAAAADRAGVYAPEINLKATSAGGVTSDLVQTMDQFNNTSLAGLIPLAINAVLDKDPALKEAFESELTDSGKAALQDVQQYCNTGLGTHYGFETTEPYTVDGVKLAALIEKFPPLKKELERQVIGKFTPNAPVFLYNAANDDIVPVEQVRTLRDAWQARGFADLTWREDPTPGVLQKTGINHVLGMLNNLNQATTFIWDHFPSQPAQQDLSL